MVNYACDYKCFNMTNPVWDVYTANTKPSNIQKWYFERMNYRKGDVNADGYFNSADISSIQKYLAGYVSLDNVQKYLADANRNGNVNVNDVTKIQNILAGNDIY